MTRHAITIVVAIAAAVAIGVGAVLYAPRHESPSDIRSLAKSGASEQEMIAKVEKSPVPYKLSADEVIALKKDGVPDSVLAAMIRHLREKPGLAQH